MYNSKKIAKQKVGEISEKKSQKLRKKVGKIRIKKSEKLGQKACWF